MKKIIFVSLAYLIIYSHAIGQNTSNLKPSYSGKKNEYGYIDSVSNKLVLPYKYSDAGKFVNDRAVVRRNDLYGIIDPNGNEIVKCENRIIRQIKALDGIFIVSKQIDPKVNYSVFWGIFDKTGKQILPFEYASIELLEGRVLMIQKGAKYGLANCKGEILASPDNANKIKFTNGIVALKSVVNSTVNYGVVKNTGEIIIPFEYKELDFSAESIISAKTFKDTYFFYTRNGKKIHSSEFEDKERVSISNLGKNYKGFYYYIVKKDGKWGLLTPNGLLIPCEYDKTSEWNQLTEGKVCLKKNGYAGIIDTTGKILIPFEYDRLSTKSVNGLIEAKKNGKYGLIDMNNTVSVGFDYDRIVRVSNGIAYVSNNNKYGMVSLQNKVLLPCEYDFMGSDYPNNYVQKDKKYGVVDSTGRFVAPLVYDEMPKFDEKEGIMGLCDGKTILLFDRKGSKLAILENYDALGFFSNGMASVRSNGLYGYINTKGVLVIPCKYTFAWDFNTPDKAEVMIDGKYNYTINRAGQIDYTAVGSMVPYIYNDEVCQVHLSEKPKSDDPPSKSEEGSIQIVQSFSKTSGLFCRLDYTLFTESGIESVKSYYKSLIGFNKKIIFTAGDKIESETEYTHNSKYKGYKIKYIPKEGGYFTAILIEGGNKVFFLTIGGHNAYVSDALFTYYVNKLVIL